MHRAKPRVPILMYHSLSKTGTAPFRRFTVAPELFQAHLGYLADQGYRTLTMSQLVELRARRGPLPAKPVVLTLAVPAAALIALATGDMDAAPGNGLTASGDESQLASLFSVLRPGDPGFNIVEP